MSTSGLDSLAYHTCSLPPQRKSTSIKSGSDHSNGLMQPYSQLFMNIHLLKPQTRNHMSNQGFLADIQPGAAPVMIITRRLNTYNIILNFTIQPGSLYYHNSRALISIKSPLAPSLGCSPRCNLAARHHRAQGGIKLIIRVCGSERQRWHVRNKSAFDVFATSEWTSDVLSVLGCVSTPINERS